LNLGPERLPEPMGRYQTSVALDERFGPNDISVDLGTDQQHPLHTHQVQIATNPHGRAVLVLTFTAVDLWTAILTSMALVRQSGYLPIAVQASPTTGQSGTERLAPTVRAPNRQTGGLD
jgi:hypothetical protein